MIYITEEGTNQIRVVNRTSSEYFSGVGIGHFTEWSYLSDLFRNKSVVIAGFEINLKIIPFGHLNISPIEYLSGGHQSPLWRNIRKTYSKVARDRNS
jgi:hypothetical protein